MGTGEARSREGLSNTTHELGLYYETLTFFTQMKNDLNFDDVCWAIFCHLLMIKEDAHGSSRAHSI